MQSRQPPAEQAQGLASDQESGILQETELHNMEWTQVYFSHFICIFIYIHYTLILQVVKAVTFK